MIGAEVIWISKSSPHPVYYYTKWGQLYYGTNAWLWILNTLYMIKKYTKLQKYKYQECNVLWALLSYCRAIKHELFAYGKLLPAPWDHYKECSVSQQVWHAKESSLLAGHTCKCRAWVKSANHHGQRWCLQISAKIASGTKNYKQTFCTIYLYILL